MHNPPRERRAGEAGLDDDEQFVHKPKSLGPQEKKLSQDLKFRRATERLHALGVRPFAEALIAVSEGRDALSVCASYAQIDQALLDRFGGRTWPPSPLGAREMTKFYDFHSLTELAKELGRPKASLHALDPAGDPFNCGSPAQIDAANWFADLWHKHMKPGGHLRRFHYKLVVLADTPMHGGGIYVNDDRCYAVLNRVSQWARYLDLVSIDDIVDRRNPAAHIFLSDPEEADVFVAGSTSWSVGAMPSFPELPRLHLSPPTVVQRYHIEIWVEKSDIEDVVLPLARSHEFNYLPFIGQPSISACRDLVDRAERSNRPVRILYISDFDPQGQSMPVAAARKIEWVLAKRGLDLDIEVRPIALTKDQCIEFALPRTPIKETDALKGSFERRHGEGATELDALEAIHPGVLRELIMAEVDRYYHYDLQDRVAAEESSVSAALRAVTQECVERHIESVDALRDEYQRVVAELRSWQRRAAPVWNEIISDLEEEEPDLSEHPWPEGEPGDEHSDPLFDSYRDYVEQIGVYKRFQGRSIEDGRRAANKARGAGGISDETAHRRALAAAATSRWRERKKAEREAAGADGGAP